MPGALGPRVRPACIWWLWGSLSLASMNGGQ